MSGWGPPPYPPAQRVRPRSARGSGAGMAWRVPAAGAAAAGSTRDQLSAVRRSLRGVRSELAGARSDAAPLARAVADATRTLEAAQAELATAQTAWVEARRRSVAAEEALSQATAQVI